LLTRGAASTTATVIFPISSSGERGGARGRPLPIESPPCRLWRGIFLSLRPTRSCSASHVRSTSRADPRQPIDAWVLFGGCDKTGPPIHGRRPSANLARRCGTLCARTDEMRRSTSFHRRVCLVACTVVAWLFLGAARGPEKCTRAVIRAIEGQPRLYGPDFAR